MSAVSPGQRSGETDDQAGIPPTPKRVSTTWTDFMRSQANALLACDPRTTPPPHPLGDTRLHARHLPPTRTLHGPSPQTPSILKRTSNSRSTAANWLPVSSGSRSEPHDASPSTPASRRTRRQRSTDRSLTRRSLAICGSSSSTTERTADGAEHQRWPRDIPDRSTTGSVNARGSAKPSPCSMPWTPAVPGRGRTSSSAGGVRTGAGGDGGGDGGVL